MRDLLLLVVLARIVYGADCTPPADALIKLRAYLSYANRSEGSPALRHFSFAQAGGDTLFLQREVPKYFDPSRPVVYGFRKGHNLMMGSCPKDPRWASCAEKELLEFIHQPTTTTPATGPVCELSVMVPAWHTSPDSALKRKLASEVLQELIQFGYRSPREVYVRDFNVADPELDFYIVDREGNGNIQGCHFDAEISPHCGWHLYGMSPTEAVKRDIMVQPYKLLPQDDRPAK